MNDLDIPTSLPATTTTQEDITHAGQRRVNLIWEATQSLIAIFVVVSTITTDALIALWHFFGVTNDISANQLTGVTNLNVMCGLVIGFYFSRTNHQAIGGIGAKPQQQYQGR